MKYIHGEEFYVTEKLYFEPEIPDKLTESLLGIDAEEAQAEINKYIEDNKTQKRDNYHVVLIAKNYL